MSIMAKTPSGYKKIGSAYLGERPVDKVFNANGDVVYALQRELTGVPPLLFKGKEQSDLLNYRISGNTETKQRDYSGSSPLTVPVHDGELYNYRIYGNTVNGESVGDRTGNLCGINGTIAFSNDVSVKSKDGEFIIQSNGINDTISAKSPQYRNKFKLHLTAGTYTYSYHYNGMSVGIVMGMYTIEGETLNSNFTLLNDTDIYIGFYIPPNTTCNQRLMVMLNAGSTPLPYEPYGYKVPIAVTNSGTTSNETIYLPEPIKMVGSEAEYVDFYSQKQYFADGTNTAVTIPALPISAGTNTVTVNTTVQPSNVEVSVDENVSVGDLVTSGQHAGEYKVPVTVEGKNLFDENSLISPIFVLGRYLSWYFDDEHYLLATDKSVDDRLWSYDYSQIHIALSSGTYTIQLSGVAASNQFAGIYITNSNNDRICSENISGKTSSAMTFTLNTPETIGIEIKVFDGKYRIMLVEGSTPLPYEPYHAPVTTPIYLPEPIKMVGDEAEYIDYAEQKQHRVRKNLVSSYLAGNNLARYSSALWCEIDFKPNTEYILDFISGAGVQFYTNEHVFGVARYTNMLGGKKSLRIKTISTIDKNEINHYNANKGWVILKINDVATEDIEISDVQIRLATIEDDTYEPYIENVDLDVTLPALPTLPGTNTMSVDTEVQPSRMDIKGRIKTLT